MTERERNPGLVWLELAVLVVLMLGARLTILGQPLENDEIYHLLAARSWAADGTLSIADGEYRRGALFTITLGILFRLFGEGEIVGALFSVAPGVLWVVAIFLWTRWAVGRAAAWSAALLFGFAPHALLLSQYVRFYVWHGLFFWLGAAQLYVLVAGRRSVSVSVLLGLGAAAAFALAAHLQITTMVGLVGVAGWLAIAWGPGLIRQARTDRRLAWALIGFAAVLIAGGLAALASGFAGDLFARYRSVAPWAAHYTYLFYHWWLLDHYPTLWTLLPLAALVALARVPGPGLFCVVIFCVAAVLQSFGGFKGQRYIYYAMPFFFVLWGIVIAEAIPYVRRLAAEAGSRLLLLRPAGGVAKALGWAGVGVVLLFGVISNEALPMGLRIAQSGSFDVMRRSLNRPPPARPDWVLARETIKPLVDRATVVVVTNSMYALYYLGRYDVEISADSLVVSDTKKEWGLDPRTGRHVIDTPESLRRLLLCYPDGLVVTALKDWRSPAGIANRGGGDLLRAHAEEVALPRQTGLRAFTWRRSGVVERGAECATLPPLAAAG